jgi:hypothetical protein
LTLRTRSVRTQFLAVAVHLLVVALGFRLGALCVWHRGREGDI